MRVAPGTSTLKVFISHSNQDESLASGLVSLLMRALSIDAEHIRCTSVNGFKLPPGQDIDDLLRREILDCQLLIGLITPNSLKSQYVLFELAARWGASRHVIPVLALGTTYDDIPIPIKRLRALDFTKDGDIENLVSSMSGLLHGRIAPLSQYADQIKAVRALATRTSTSSMLRANAYDLLCKANYVSSSVTQTPAGRNYVFDVWRAYNDYHALTLFGEWLSEVIPRDASCIVAIGRSGLPPAVFAAISRKIPFYCVYKPTTCTTCKQITYTSSTKLVDEASQSELANAVVFDNSIHSGDSIAFALQLIFGRKGNTSRTFVLVDHDLDDEAVVARRSQLKEIKAGNDFMPKALIRDSTLLGYKSQSGA